MQTSTQAGAVQPTPFKIAEGLKEPRNAPKNLEGRKVVLETSALPVVQNAPFSQVQAVPQPVEEIQKDSVEMTRVTVVATSGDRAQKKELCYWLGALAVCVVAGVYFGFQNS